MINEIFQFSVIQNQSLTIRNGCKLDDMTCILVLFFSFLELVNFVESESSKRALHGGLFFETANKTWKRNKISNTMNTWLFISRKNHNGKKLKKMFSHIKRSLTRIFIYMKNKHVPQKRERKKNTCKK